ncbi:response regulator [Stenotrophomonas sp. YIM B06876]|uniref:response regulator n=1 Tax=Stenotrophomonas sp. YIM B06876 TaxID=3060211 RepID=UPI002738AAFD|nr:response regulator [Stenotrophomonas sp. YIM B06876]
MRILLIEDDQKLAEGLLRALAQSGHACDHVTTAQQVPGSVAVVDYDLLILDLGLPDADGLELLAQLRRDGLQAPVLILTARDGIEDRIRGLDSGADDYLAKPFALGELEARLRALARRRGQAASHRSIGRLVFDTGNRSLQLDDGTRLDLTARELALIEILLQQPGRVVSKQRLFDAVYNWDADASLSVIEVHMSRLRRKLADADTQVGIRMLRGLGYRLESTP